MQQIEEYVKWHHVDAINDTLTKGDPIGLQDKLDFFKK